MRTRNKREAFEGYFLRCLPLIFIALVAPWGVLSSLLGHVERVGGYPAVESVHTCPVERAETVINHVARRELCVDELVIGGFSVSGWLNDVKDGHFVAVEAALVSSVPVGDEVASECFSAELPNLTSAMHALLSDISKNGEQVHGAVFNLLHDNFYGSCPALP